MLPSFQGHVDGIAIASANIENFLFVNKTTTHFKGLNT